MNKETESKIGQLQLYEQSLNNFLMQKQQIQVQLTEIESALKELKDAKTAYKIVGNVMVDAQKEELEKDLKQKKEMIQLRIKTIENQERQIREKAEVLQTEIMKGLKSEKSK